MDVAQWIENSGLNKRAVSRRSGVARTTVDRIIKDVRPAKWDTLEEVAAACGIQLEVVASPLAEPLALEAARVVIEPGYEPSDSAGVLAWTARIRRWQENADDDEEFLVLATRAANVGARPDLRKYRAEDLPSVLDGARESESLWAVSGPAPASAEPVTDRPAQPSSADADTDPPTIIWAEDADAVAQLARVTPSEKGNVWLLPAPAALFAGSAEDGPTIFVSEVQGRLDRMSLGA